MIYKANEYEWRNFQPNTVIDQRNLAWTGRDYLQNLGKRSFESKGSPTEREPQTPLPPLRLLDFILQRYPSKVFPITPPCPTSNFVVPPVTEGYPLINLLY